MNIKILELYRSFVPPNSFLAHVLTLVTGTTLAQTINIVAVPFLTRIYSPAEFGIYAVYASSVAIISVFAAGRYELAILLPEKDEDSICITLLVIVIAGLTSLLGLIAVVLFKEQIYLLFGRESSGNWIFLIPYAIFSTSLFQGLSNLVIRQKGYDKLALAQISQSTVTIAISLISGLYSYGVWGLVWGSFVGQVVAIGALAPSAYSLIRSNFPAITLIRIIEQAKRYVDFPRYLIIAHLLNAASQNMPTFLLNSFYGSYQVGFFSFAQRIVSVPITVIGRAFGNVFRQRASEDFCKKGNSKEIFTKTLKKLVLISSAPFLLLFLFAPESFSLVFGSEWKTAGEFARIISLMMFLQFVASPLSSMFAIAEKQKADLIFQLSLFTVITSGIVFGYYYFHSIVHSLSFYNFAYSLMYLACILLSYKFARGRQI